MTLTICPIGLCFPLGNPEPADCRARRGWRSSMALILDHGHEVVAFAVDRVSAEGLANKTGRRGAFERLPTSVVLAFGLVGCDPAA